MNGPTIVPVTVGICLLQVQHSVLREVKTGVAVMTLHIVSGKIIQGETAGRELDREELDALDASYGDAIEGALWEWYATQGDGAEEEQP